jgi:hypothetical protein
MSAKELEQFYTKPEVALALIQSLDMTLHDLIIEPSFGEGAFLQDKVLSKDCIYMDIAAQDESRRKDFLTYQIEERYKNVLVLGNPPFTKAVKFFNHAASFPQVRIIAFILPMSFRKDSMKERLDRGFELIRDSDLPNDAFVFEGKETHIPSCFQVWERRTETAKKSKNPKDPLNHPDFIFCKDPREADFAIQRVGHNAGRVYSRNFLQRSSSSHYFIKQSKPEVILRFMALNLEEHPIKFLTAGNPSIGKRELIKIYSEG